MGKKKRIIKKLHALSRARHDGIFTLKLYIKSCTSHGNIWRKSRHILHYLIFVYTVVTVLSLLNLCVFLFLFLFLAFLILNYHCAYPLAIFRRVILEV
jgi:hypothetical protein